MTKARFDARKAVAEAAAQSAQAPAQAKPKFKLPKLNLPIPFLRKKQTFVRRHARYECCIVGELDVVERHFDIDGVILEVSAGGVLFRPASTFILNRLGERVRARFEGVEMEGVIMNVRPVGYGVKFDELIPDAAIERLVADFGLKTAAAA
jgi:hypothetical protein